MKLILSLIALSFLLSSCGKIGFFTQATENASSSPPVKVFEIQNKVACLQEANQEIIGCEQNGTVSKFCNLIRNNSERAIRLKVYEEVYDVDKLGTEVFNVLHENIVEKEIGANSLVEMSYFEGCSTALTPTHTAIKITEVAPLESKAPFTVENKVPCPQPSNDSVKTCSFNSVDSQFCNIIRNTNSQPLTVNNALFDTYSVDSTGVEVFKSQQKNPITVGANALKQYSYYTKCDVAVGTLHKSVRVTDLSPLTNIKKANAVAHIKDLGSAQSAHLCSEECSGTSPASHCFISTFSVSKPDKKRYKEGQDILYKAYSNGSDIDSISLLNKFNLPSKAECSLGNMKFENGIYSANSKDCGFKTTFLPNLDLVGSWQNLTRYRVSKLTKNHLVFDFIDGPFAWFIDDEGEPDEELNKEIAGNISSIEITDSGLYIGLPNICLVAKVKIRQD